MLRLWYIFPEGKVVDAGLAQDSRLWLSWLWTQAEITPEVIFFLTTETTDIW